MGTRGGLARCDARAIEAFVATLTGYQVKTVEQKLCSVRSFLRFAAADGLLDAAVLDAVPTVRASKQAGVPSVWDAGHVARILDAIDRCNPCGKRDYAIILLIAKLGLRSIDVKRLEFADFDWPGNRLFVMQAKTGRRVQLPLLKEVGWAVIDYIRHGRPVCDCPQVFLRHLAPIGPFSDQDHLHQILIKHARVAHVPVSDKRRHGMHSLRHTLATRLLEDGTPVEQIAEILGHQSVQSTGVYLKRVGETRRREAVDRLVALQFDRHGNRIWRDAKALLESEHARRAVGAVAVPYGNCSEPANVAAGGQDCPVRFRCVGCGHFSTDISYLPDLERYLADLLRHRERLAAVIDADAWAKTEAMPSDTEIQRIRHLITRMQADITDLTDEDRAQIADAVAVVRQHRKRITSLGIPRTRQPQPHDLPEHTP